MLIDHADPDDLGSHARTLIIGPCCMPGGSSLQCFAGFLGGQSQVLVEVFGRVTPGCEGLCQGREFFPHRGSINEGEDEWGHHKSQC